MFCNLEPQNSGLVDIKKDLNLKRSKGIFVRENLKHKHRYFVTGSEDTLMHKAERPSKYFSNSFTHNQAEQI